MCLCDGSFDEQDSVLVHPTLGLVTMLDGAEVVGSVVSVLLTSPQASADGGVPGVCTFCWWYGFILREYGGGLDYRNRSSPADGLRTK